MKLPQLFGLAGSVCAMIAVFYHPLGLSDEWFWPTAGGALFCFVTQIVLQRHRRNARLAAGLLPVEKPPTNRSFWLVILLIVAVSLSGPLWLPYTGVTLPGSTLVITSIISCAFAVVVFVLSWRYWSKKI